MKKTELTLLGIMALGCVSCNQEIAINEAIFPDEAFRTFILSQSYGQDGILTTDEIKAITEINCSAQGIQSIKGIELFSALTTLNCADNQITELDVTQNEKLTNLNCANNKITYLNVSKNKELTALDCRGNQLEALDVDAKTELIGKEKEQAE